VTTAAPTAATGFSVLRVAQVDALTDDSVAVTLAVPDEQADRFRFAPGQHLTCAGWSTVRTCVAPTRSAAAASAGRSASP
jgi:ring-1,2-phenylacetyl-CoA epoxidase subunit PaaE